MKKLLLMVAAVATLFTACNYDCGYDHTPADVDYSKSIIGCWDISCETISELVEFYADGTFDTLGNRGEGVFAEEGTWTLDKNHLVLTTTEGKIHFSGTITIYPKDVMLMVADGSNETLVYHYWVHAPFPTSLVGTWTCVDADFAEALTIREDATLVSSRVENGQYIENMAGLFLYDDTTGYGISFDDETYRWGSYEVISGDRLVLTDNKANTRRTYLYCNKDLSEEIVGMWVCNDGPLAGNNDMSIQTYDDKGNVYSTGFVNEGNDALVNNAGVTYKVVGDLLIQIFPKEGVVEGVPQYITARLSYAPNGTSLGDIMTQKVYAPSENGPVETVSSWLRVSESLDLASKKYDYSSLYISNVSGLDKDIEFMGYTLNFAHMDGSKLDLMLKSILFAVEFPDADHLNYSYQMNGNKETYEADIEVEGNKLTVKMSEKVSTLKDVVLYAFQDADASQMHIYMHKTAFVNFYTNMQAMLMKATNEQFDINNAEAVNAIYNSINEAVETINLSLVMKSASRAL